MKLRDEADDARHRIELRTFEKGEVAQQMGKINGVWHTSHRMPARATLDQRVAWHLAHLKACACRSDLPAGILAELKRRGIKPPRPKAGGAEVRLMEQRLTLVTLGVKDLDRALRFYRDGLGWQVWSGSGGDFALFVLKGGMGLALYPRHLLAADAGVPDSAGFGGMTIAQNVGKREQVDALLSAAVAAGGVLLKPASEKPWGYTGYFADPDGHPWEVAYVPSLTLRDGMLSLK